MFNNLVRARSVVGQGRQVGGLGVVGILIIQRLDPAASVGASKAVVADIGRNTIQPRGESRRIFKGRQFLMCPEEGFLGQVVSCSRIPNDTVYVAADRFPMVSQLL